MSLHLHVLYNATILETYNVFKNISILRELLQYKWRCSRWKTTTHGTCHLNVNAETTTQQLQCVNK